MTKADAEEKRNDWLWLAFGIFYPRPKRSARTFKLRDINHLEVSPEVVEAFVRTLRNPAAELVYPPGNLGDDIIAPATDLMVCTVKRDASVEIFDTLIKQVTRTDTLKERNELKAICERVKDGAVCVVVPGVGLGWVQPECVEHIERESLESCRSNEDWRYDLELFHNGLVWKELKDGVRLLFATIGPQIRSLTCRLDRYQDDYATYMPHILAHCVNLQHLRLRRKKVIRIDADPLLNAMGGELGTRLLSLTLSKTQYFSNKLMTKLAAILVKRPAPVLRELRFVDSALGLQTNGLEDLTAALQVNRTLAVLQLPDPSSFWGDEKLE